MKKNFIILIALTCLLIQTQSMYSLHFIFPQFRRDYAHRIPHHLADPEMLSAQSTTLKTDSDREVTTTSMPHTIVHVPGHQKPVLAEQIKAVNVPDTVGHILKKVGKDKDGTVFVNINLNGQTVSESTAIAHSSHVGEAIEWIKLLKDKAQKGYGSALDWITNNKKRFALYCFGGTYCITQFYLWHLAHSLQSSSCWSMWKHQSSLEELYRCRQEDLAQDVLITINSRLSSTKNFADRVTPFVTFLKETDEELQALNTYRSLVSFIQNVHLTRIFFYNGNLYEDSLNRINRLQYIKNSVLAWLSDAQKQKPFLTQKNNAI